MDVAATCPVVSPSQVYKSNKMAVHHNTGMISWAQKGGVYYGA